MTHEIDPGSSQSSLSDRMRDLSDNFRVVGDFKDPDLPEGVQREVLERKDLDRLRQVVRGRLLNTIKKEKWHYGPKLYMVLQHCYV